MAESFQAFFFFLKQISGQILSNLQLAECDCHCRNVSTTPIMAMRCRKCLHLSVVQLRGNHWRKSHYCHGVVNRFGYLLPNIYLFCLLILQHPNRISRQQLWAYYPHIDCEMLHSRRRLMWSENDHHMGCCKRKCTSQYNTPNQHLQGRRNVKNLLPGPCSA